MRFSFCLTLLLVLAPIAEADELGERELEAFSYISAFEGNCLALESYDVSMTIEKFVVSVEGKSEEELLNYRLIADHLKDRYFFVYSGSKELCDIHTDGNEVRTGGRAFCFDQSTNEGWVRNFSGSVAKVRKNDAMACLGLSGFPNVRLIGLYECPRTFNRFSYSIEQLFAGEFHQGMEVSSRRVSPKITEFIFLSPYGIRDLKFVRKLKFDTERHVPVEIVQEVRDGSKIDPRRREVIKWAELNGVMMPTSVQGERFIKSKINGDTRRVSELYDATLKWQSVNEGFPEETDLEPRVLRDVSKLLELLGASDEESEDE